MTLVLALATGTIAWELVNPVSMFHRGLIFGMGAGWAVILAMFLFDLFVSNDGWCGHLCPVGAFYSLIGKVSLVRTVAVRRAACNDCMDCFVVCPEPQVIRPALKGVDGAGPVILAAQLHQLRPLHRRLLEGRVRLRHAFRQQAGKGFATGTGDEAGGVQIG